MELLTVISLIVGSGSLVAAIIALVMSHNANKVAATGLELSQTANDTAAASKRLAEEANGLSIEGNTFAKEANDLAKKGIDYSSEHADFDWSLEIYDGILHAKNTGNSIPGKVTMRGTLSGLVEFKYASNTLDFEEEINFEFIYDTKNKVWYSSKLDELITVFKATYAGLREEHRVAEINAKPLEGTIIETRGFLASNFIPEKVNFWGPSNGQLYFDGIIFTQLLEGSPRWYEQKISETILDLN